MRGFRRMCCWSQAGFRPARATWCRRRLVGAGSEGSLSQGASEAGQARAVWDGAGSPGRETGLSGVRPAGEPGQYAGGLPAPGARGDRPGAWIAGERLIEPAACCRWPRPISTGASVRRVTLRGWLTMAAGEPAACAAGLGGVARLADGEPVGRVRDFRGGRPRLPGGRPGAVPVAYRDALS